MKKQVLISAAIISAMVLGTACGATANADTHSMAPGSEVTTDTEDAGVEYSFEGDTITIKIPENATTGYTWMIENAENMEQISDEFEPATNESEDPDAQLAGAGGTRILVFKVTGAEPVVHLNHGRSWDASTYKAYTLNVEADENMNIYSASFCQVVNNAE